MPLGKVAASKQEPDHLRHVLREITDKYDVEQEIGYRPYRPLESPRGLRSVRTGDD